MLLFLTSCYFPIEIPQSIPEKLAPQIPNRILEITPPKSTQPGIYATNCDLLTADNFGYVDEITPVGNTSISPTVKIKFQPYHQQIVSDWTLECVPDSFTIYLSPGPNYSYEIVVPVIDPTFSTFDDHIMYETVLTNQLQADIDYRWVVIGHYNSIDIGGDDHNLLHQDNYWFPYLQENTLIIPGKTFHTASLTNCTGYNNITLINPPNLEIIHFLPDTQFTWDAEPCKPDYFRIQFSMWPDMSYPISYDYYIPQEHYTIYHNGNNPYYSHLRNCTQYYWQIIPVLLLPQGDIICEFGGCFQPYGKIDADFPSEIRSFYLNMSGCPTPTLTPRYSITLIPTRTQATSEPIIIDCGSITNATTCNGYTACRWVPKLTAPSEGTCVNK